MSKHKNSEHPAPRMLVTGAAGMTGYHVQEVFSDYELELTNKDTLDVRHLSHVLEASRSLSPDIILHLAAETDIDLCEREPKEAFRTNTVGTQNVAIACQETNCLMVYFSTTSVFPGGSGEIYSEFDNPQPIHVHGRSKWEGEKLIPRFTKRYLIVRPGWMFGGFEKDRKFVGELRRQIVKNGAKAVLGVGDTSGSPSYASDCLRLTRRLIEDKLQGIFHVVNSGHCTRFEMAQVIADHYAVSAQCVSSSAFTHTVSRPSSEMVQNWMLEFYGLDGYVRDWRSALKEYIRQWDKLDSKK